MSRIVCSRCGAEEDERSMALCQRCGAVVCPRCTAQGGQYCVGCQTAISSLQEMI